MRTVFLALISTSHTAFLRPALQRYSSSLSSATTPRPARRTSSLHVLVGLHCDTRLPGTVSRLQPGAAVSSTSFTYLIQPRFVASGCILTTRASLNVLVPEHRVRLGGEHVRDPAISQGPVKRSPPGTVLEHVGGLPYLHPGRNGREPNCTSAYSVHDWTYTPRACPRSCRTRAP